MATTNMRIVIRRDDSAAWTDNGEVVTLLSGEQGYEVNTGKLKIGNGLDVWNDLPYFAGGITDYDKVTLITDASGVLMLNEESVIGDLGAATTVQEYVDIKTDALATSILDEAAAREAADSVEAAAREAADTVLGARIDQELLDRAAADLILQEAINEFGQRVVTLESVSATIDYVDSVVGLANDSIADLEADLGFFKEQTQAEFDSQGNMIVALQVADTVETAARIAGDESVAAMLADSVTALELVDAGLATDLQDSVDALVATDAGLATDLQDSVTALEAADAAEATDRIEGDESVAAMLADSVAALELVDAGLATDLQDSVTALQAVDAGNYTELGDSIIALRDGVAGRALTDLIDVDGIPTANALLIYDGAKWVPYGIESHADDAAAATAGFDVGDLYRGGSNRLRVRMV